MARTPRSDEERRKIRQRILEAATRVFAERGLHSATMDQVATAASFSTASLYNYFPNKQALVRALLRSTVDQLMATVEAPLPLALTSLQRLELPILRLLIFAAEHRWVLDLLFSPALAYEGRRPSSHRASATQLHQRLIEAISKDVSSLPWMVPEQVDRSGRLLLSTVRSESFSWHVDGVPEDLPRLANLLTAYWLAGTRVLVLNAKRQATFRGDHEADG